VLSGWAVRRGRSHLGGSDIRVAEPLRRARSVAGRDAHSELSKSSRDGTCARSFHAAGRPAVVGPMLRAAGGNLMLLCNSR
jgi:hypothetical protein